MTPARRPLPDLSRRHVMRLSAALAAGTAVSPLLSACGERPDQGTGPTEFPIATPDKPVTIKIFDDNPAIESDLAPDQAKVLKVLNYAEYIAPQVKTSYTKKFGAQVQVTPYGDFEELQRRLAAPGSAFDVVFAGPTITTRLAYNKLIQPLNHDYLPNLTNLWPAFQDPWYDQGAGYSVPYNVYTHGIGYRADRVGTVPDNGYLMLWDPKFTGQIGIFDDAIDALSMPLLAWEITDDINTDNPAHINAARDKLIELLELDVRVSIAQYELIPSGKRTVHQAWSGDLTFASSYLSRGSTLDDIGYWVPEDRSQRVTSNETISVATSAPSPVLAHAFINHLLDNQVAEANVSWTGYQPPISVLTPDYLMKKEIFPEQLESAILVADDFADGIQFTELTTRTRNQWLKAWQEFLNG